MHEIYHKALIGLWPVLYKLTALKHSMQLNDNTFKIGILRRRRRLFIYHRFMIYLMHRFYEHSSLRAMLNILALCMRLAHT